MNLQQISWPLETDQLNSLSKKGHKGFSIAKSDFEAADKIPDSLSRKDPLPLPECSELTIVRHFTRLSQLN